MSRCTPSHVDGQCETVLVYREHSNNIRVVIFPAFPGDITVYSLLVRIIPTYFSSLSRINTVSRRPDNNDNDNNNIIIKYCSIVILAPLYLHVFIG